MFELLIISGSPLIGFVYTLIVENTLALMYNEKSISSILATMGKRVGSKDISASFLPRLNNTPEKWLYNLDSPSILNRRN